MKNVLALMIGILIFSSGFAVAEQVTYRGVLDMLNSCRIKYSEFTTGQMQGEVATFLESCDNRCNRDGQTCIAAYYQQTSGQEKEDNGAIPLDCETSHYYNANFPAVKFCQCCGEGNVVVPPTTECESYCSGNSCRICEGNSVRYTDPANDEWNMEINYISSSSVRLEIEGQVTNSLGENDEYPFGNNRLLVTDIVSQQYVGGLSYVDLNIARKSTQSTEQTASTTATTQLERRGIFARIFGKVVQAFN